MTQSTNSGPGNAGDSASAPATPPASAPSFAPPQQPYSAGSPLPPPYQPRPQYLVEANQKKILCGLLAILVGNLGIHKFILGCTTAGVIMVVVSCVGICPILIPGIIVMRIISLIEGIMYLTKSDEDFYQTYMVKKKEWF